MNIWIKENIKNKNLSNLYFSNKYRIYSGMGILHCTYNFGLWYKALNYNCREYSEILKRANYLTKFQINKRLIWKFAFRKRNIIWVFCAYFGVKAWRQSNKLCTVYMYHFLLHIMYMIQLFAGWMLSTS